jgi:hypothetical protein
MSPNLAALRARAAVLVACVVALGGAPAFAADAPAKKATAPKAAAKPKTNVMSRDQLRACMDEQDRLQAMRTRVEREQSALDRQRNEVATLDAALAQKRAALDPADENGKQSLDAEVARRDEVVDAYNARLATLREDGKRFDTGRQAWVERCADRDFDEMDEAAIKKERQRAARAAK